MKTLYYNYHDSLIDKVKLTETTLTFYIDLYSIFYPTKPKIKLSFGLTDNYSICKNWTELLLNKFDKTENYSSLRIDNIEHLNTDLNTNLFLWKIECDHIDVLNFKSSSFKETEVKKEIHIDEQLLNICNDILKENLSIAEWTEIESDDMFQTENYLGGFDGTEKEFVFSFYNDKEYWFQMNLEQVKEISIGQIKSVFGIQSDYYND